MPLAPTSDTKGVFLTPLAFLLLLFTAHLAGQPRPRAPAVPAPVHCSQQGAHVVQVVQAARKLG